MSDLICAFGKGVKGFEGKFLDLLFEHQDIGINTFISLFNFSCSSFKLGQSDNIDFNICYSLKLFFGKQQIPKKQLLAINNIVMKKYKGKITNKIQSISH